MSLSKTFLQRIYLNKFFKHKIMNKEIYSLFRLFEDMNKEMKLSEYLNKSKKIQVGKFTKKIRIAVLSSFTVNGLAETLLC